MTALSLEGYMYMDGISIYQPNGEVEGMSFLVVDYMAPAQIANGAFTEIFARVTPEMTDKEKIKIIVEEMCRRSSMLLMAIL